MGGVTTVPVLEGWFTLSETEPQLIGSRCIGCGTYYFPKQRGFCRNPKCDCDSLEEVGLSRSGKLWSFTTASYQPPKPYVSGEPFEPFAIAAVELERERMVILGQVASGVGIEKLFVGMAMELVVEPLFEEEGVRRVTWKWQPAKEGGR